jgi:hypothetical protein
MSKIVRYEFMGSWLFFWLVCITVIGIPVADPAPPEWHASNRRGDGRPRASRFCAPSSEAKLRPSRNLPFLRRIPLRYERDWLVWCDISKRGIPENCKAAAFHRDFSVGIVEGVHNHKAL